MWLTQKGRKEGRKEWRISHTRMRALFCGREMFMGNWRHFDQAGKGREGARPTSGVAAFVFKLERNICILSAIRGAHFPPPFPAAASLDWTCTSFKSVCLSFVNTAESDVGRLGTRKSESPGLLPRLRSIARAHRTFIPSWRRWRRWRHRGARFLDSIEKGG